MNMNEFENMHHELDSSLPSTSVPVKKKGLDLSARKVDLDSAFLLSPTTMDFVIPGFLLGTVGALVATSGTGKSFWSIEAAMAIASGGLADPLSLRPEVGGRVVILSLEDPLVIITNRVHAMGKNLNTDGMEAVLENLDILDLYGERIDLMNQQTVDSIVEYCRGARLIVIDTLSRAHSLDENKNGEMAQLMSQMDSITKSTGASVLFVHHISKGSAKEDAGNQASASRGASVLVDNSRFVCYLQSINKNHPEFTSIQESERWRYIQHGVSKVNYSSRPKEIWLEKGNGGVLAYSLINKVNRGFESTPIVVDDMTPPEMKPPVPFVVPTPDEPMVTHKAEEEDGNVPDFFAAPKFEMKGINGERIDF